jgi:hypothetical protein
MSLWMLLTAGTMISMSSTKAARNGPECHTLRNDVANCDTRSGSAARQSGYSLLPRFRIGRTECQRSQASQASPRNKLSEFWKREPAPKMKNFDHQCTSTT